MIKDNQVHLNRAHVIVDGLIVAGSYALSYYLKFESVFADKRPGGRLSMPVIAEGVETKEQADFLTSIGCDVVQGYYYAKPMSLSEYEVFAEKHGVDEVFHKIS